MTSQNIKSSVLMALNVRHDFVVQLISILTFQEAKTFREGMLKGLKRSTALLCGSEPLSLLV